MADGAADATDPGSFRDPSGQVLIAGGRVFRTVNAPAAGDLDALVASGLLDTLAFDGRVIATSAIDRADVPPQLTDGLATAPHRLLEHERIQFVSYPYEWPFSLLARAGVHLLDLHIELLKSGFTLSDASAYNIQFRGSTPVFIDVLSIRRYREGEYWAGYRQFCEHFLNPLLLTATTGVAHHPWFRGSLEGIPVEEMARLLPLRAKLSGRALIHVTLHARMLSNARRDGAAAGPPRRPMSKAAVTWMLNGMREWIAALKPRGVVGTPWSDYVRRASYTSGEMAAKSAFVARYAAQQRPALLFDLGCNTGAFAQVALTAGAGRVIGFDSDLGALEAAVARADSQRLAFLPLVLDAANPSPDQGWAQRERRGFSGRGSADGLLALALLHHIVIGRNVPMAQAVAWLVALAPSGVIEFVPKGDPMVQRMLAHRADVFPDYHISEFRRLLTERARILNEAELSAAGRTLFEYHR